MAHYLLTTLPGLTFFALGEHELKVGPGGRGQHVVQVQQLLGLNAVAHENSHPHPPIKLQCSKLAL